MCPSSPQWLHLIFFTHSSNGIYLQAAIVTIDPSSKPVKYIALTWPTPSHWCTTERSMKQISRSLSMAKHFGLSEVSGCPAWMLDARSRVPRVTQRDLNLALSAKEIHQEYSKWYCLEDQIFPMIVLLYELDLLQSLRSAHHNNECQSVKSIREEHQCFLDSSRPYDLSSTCIWW